MEGVSHDLPDGAAVQVRFLKHLLVISATPEILSRFARCLFISSRLQRACNSHKASSFHSGKRKITSLSKSLSGITAMLRNGL